MRDLRAAVLAAALLIAGGGPVRAEEPPELSTYLNQIRAWGMTESARTHLLSVAMEINGHTLLTCRRDTTGTWQRGYTGTLCMRPGADTSLARRQQQEAMAKDDSLVARLQPLADADGSGFVTTQEGADFRALIEFGMFAELMRTKEKVGRADIAQIAGVQLGKLRARIEKYNVAARRANAALAIRLPILPDDL